MSKLAKNLFGLIVLLVVTITSYAETVISGKVTDEAKEPVIGANISIKGTPEGTITDIDGKFELSTEQATPFTIVISMVGMANVEQQITGNTSDISVTLKEESNILNAVVVSASRVEEKILESPVTIEKMDQKMVKQSSSNDYYDDLAKLKGVQTVSGSMTLTSVNTRGFGGISNTRFVQLMDGMDNAAPLLNFPTGNIVGIGELDIQNVELVPGAASALYGPNAFNGILLMNSKNPFDSPGFSAQVKGGFANASNNYGTKPLGSVAMRVAHVWKRKGQDYVAIKFNANAFQGTDWYANDYTSPRDDSGPLGSQGFDGLNTYGDENNIFELNPLALTAVLGGAKNGTQNIKNGVNQIISQVTAVVTANVTAQVTAQVKANVTAQVTAGVRAAFLAANPGATQADADNYIASPAGQTAIQTQVDAQMQSQAVQGLIASNVATQMQSQNVQNILDTNIKGAIAANIPVPIADYNYVKNLDVQGFYDSIKTLTDEFAKNGLNRDGHKEGDLLKAINDKNKATSFKGDIGIYYRPFKDKSYEFSYNYRIGYGNSVYQGQARYALRSFTQQFHKAEIKGKDFFVRSYMSQTNAGDSYHFEALGATVNELVIPTSQWAQKYLGTLAPNLVGLSTMQGGASMLLGNDGALFNQLTQIARDSANTKWNNMTDEQKLALIQKVRDGYFQAGGAGFKDNSRLFHTEAMIDLSRWTNKIIDIQVGANHRLYSLFTTGTVFNEDPDGDGKFERININEYGAYLQLKRKLFKDRLTLQGSIRYDKNQNFKGVWSPRVSAVLSMGKDRNHNVRMSYQTGFRNPDTQAQYIYFPSAAILLGGTPANAEKYNIYNGGGWTVESYNAFRASVMAGAPDSSLLVTYNINYVKPERLQVVELGYKSIIAKKLLIDVNGYLNIYDDFIEQVYVHSKDTTYQKGKPVPAGQLWYPYTNIDKRIYSYGAGIGLSYVLPKNLMVKTSYNFTDYKVKDDVNDVVKHTVGFQTANHQVYVGLSGDKVWKGLGFAVDYRWQSKINWVSSFASGIVKARGVLDANLSYTIDKISTQVKVGATNIAGPGYITNVGGPLIGRTFYVGLTYDQGKKWRENARSIETEGNTSF